MIFCCRIRTANKPTQVLALKRSVGVKSWSSWKRLHFGKPWHVVQRFEHVKMWLGSQKKSQKLKKIYVYITNQHFSSRFWGKTHWRHVVRGNIVKGTLGENSSNFFYWLGASIFHQWEKTLRIGREYCNCVNRWPWRTCSRTPGD